MALRQLQTEIIVQRQVYSVKTATPAADGNNNNKTTGSWVWKSQDCQLTNQHRAVHFSFDGGATTSTSAAAAPATTTTTTTTTTDPGDVVVKWLSMWLQACERSDYFLTQQQQHELQTSDSHHANHHRRQGVPTHFQSRKLVYPTVTTASVSPPPPPPLHVSSSTSSPPLDG